MLLGHARGSMLVDPQHKHLVHVCHLNKRDKKKEEPRQYECYTCAHIVMAPQLRPSGNRRRAPLRVRLMFMFTRIHCLLKYSRIIIVGVVGSGPKLTSSLFRHKGVSLIRHHTDEDTFSATLIAVNLLSLTLTLPYAETKRERF